MLSLGVAEASAQPSRKTILRVVSDLYYLQNSEESSSIDIPKKNKKTIEAFSRRELPLESEGRVHGVP